MKKFFSENIGLKIFAMALACLLEFYFYSPDNSVTETILARVSLENLPPNLMVVKPGNGSRGLVSRVRLTGPAHLVNQVRISAPSFSVELPSNIEKSYGLALSPDQLNLPSGVEIQNIEPAQFELEFERVVRKSLKIKVPIEGSPKGGMKVSSIVADPLAVLAEGPGSELKDLTEVKTMPVDISGISTGFDREIRLEEIGRLTELGVNVVSVQVDLEPLVRKRAFASVPIKVLTGDQFTASVKPSEASIVITGPVRELERLKLSQIELFADASLFSGGKGSVELEARLPNGFTVVATSPAEVSVIVKKVGEK